VTPPLQSPEERALARRLPDRGDFRVVDHVVPFASVQATVERLRAPLEVMTFPVGHDAGPAMRAWDRFDER
jgi:hypothetical protein